MVGCVNSLMLLFFYVSSTYYRTFFFLGKSRIIHFRLACSVMNWDLFSIDQHLLKVGIR